MGKDRFHPERHLEGRLEIGLELDRKVIILSLIIHHVDAALSRV